jgi:adenine phosphoribosyltransferase
LIQALELHILEQYDQDDKPDIVVGLEARGFLFGPSLALRLGAGFVPVRKKGKLPGPTETASFEKEYGADHFEMQSDAIKKGNKVLVVDDIIATGGSAAAAGQLVQNVGGHLLGFIMILELDFLHGRDKLPAPCYTLLSTQSTSTTSEPS